MHFWKHYLDGAWLSVNVANSCVTGRQPQIRETSACRAKDQNKKNLISHLTTIYPHFKTSSDIEGGKKTKLTYSKRTPGLL